jgi:surfactin synthase thioesterase subunit
MPIGRRPTSTSITGPIRCTAPPSRTLLPGDILRGGVALLRNLHEQRDERGDEVKYRYGRVILVGHSLGSVIAYDILRHYWVEVNGRINVEHIDLGAGRCDSR